MWRPLRCWEEGEGSALRYGSVLPNSTPTPSPSTQPQTGQFGTLIRGLFTPRHCLLPRGVDTRSAPQAHPCPSHGPGQRHGARQQPADHTRAGHCLRAPGPRPLPPSVQARGPWPAVDRAEKKVGGWSGAGLKSRTPLTHPAPQWVLHQGKGCGHAPQVAGPPCRWSPCRLSEPLFQQAE